MNLTIPPEWKRRLFWTLYVPNVLILITLGLICWIPYGILQAGQWLNNQFSNFEAWCFKETREASGMYHHGGGFWTNRKP